MELQVVSVWTDMSQWREPFYQTSIVLILMNALVLKIHVRQIIDVKIWKVISNVSKKVKTSQNSAPKIIILQASDPDIQL